MIGKAELFKVLKITISFIIFIQIIFPIYGHDIDCSRDMSRMVRRMLKADIFRDLPIQPDQLPSNCILNPLYDVYSNQESHKYMITRSEWQVCGVFYYINIYLPLF